MDKYEYNQLIDWCKKKLEQQNKQCCSNKYKSGYADAMRAVMSKLHDEKERKYTEGEK
jgi:hypothetical protein